MLFSDPDRGRIAAAIGDAERATAGEIVVIVSSEVQRYAATALSGAALAGLGLPLVAVLLGWQPGQVFADWDSAQGGIATRRGIEAFALAQAAVFATVLALLWFTDLARVLTPRGLRRDRVHAAAMTQFRARGFDATAGRTGVLLYIAERERIAEVIADTAVFAAVAPEHWAATITALTDGIVAGKPADGLIAAIGLAGGVLAQHFPPVAGDVNELPDRLIEI